MKDFNYYLLESKIKRILLLENYNQKLTELITYVVKMVSQCSKGFYPGAGLSNFERFYDNREMYAKDISSSLGETAAEDFLNKVEELDMELKKENGKKKSD